MDLDEETMQSEIFEVARMTPIKPQEAFKALYTAFLNKDSGPKAGRLLAYIDKDFVLKRLTEIDFDEEKYLEQTSVTLEEFKTWLEKNKEKVEIKADSLHTYEKYSSAFAELIYIQKDKPHLIRVRGNVPAEELKTEIKQLIS